MKHNSKCCRQADNETDEDDQHDDDKHSAEPLQRSARIDAMARRSAALPAVYPGNEEYDLSLANPERNV
jgi:hypothetical protein